MEEISKLFLSGISHLKFTAHCGMSAIPKQNIKTADHFYLSNENEK